MKGAYLIIDIGTGTTRVAIVSDDGAIVTLRKADTISYVDAAVKGSNCFEPNAWRNTIFNLIRQAISDASAYSIIAVTSCSLREGIVLFDEAGNPIGGYMNSDRRGAPFMDELDWRMIWDRVGLYVSPIYSAVKMLGTRKLLQEEYSKIARVTAISDWIGYIFTGSMVWERAQAMHSALYDPKSGQWSDEMCRHFLVDKNMLPPLADAGTTLGCVSDDVCMELGFERCPDYIVGTADTQAALACVAAAEDQLVVVSGTTSPTIRVLKDYEKYEKSWTSPCASDGKLMLEINTFSSGINLQRYKSNILPQHSYEQLNEDARRLGLPKKNLPGVFAVFSPGGHIDKPAYTGGFIMSSPVAIDIRPEDFFHALALNTAMNIVLCIERQMEIKPLACDYVIGCGNGFASDTVAQAVSDITGMKVVLYEKWNEATICGMWSLCCRALKREIASPMVVKEYIPDCSGDLKDYYTQWQSCRKKINSIEVN